MKRFSKKLIITAVVVAATMGAGLAFAAWTATGTGSGYAKAKTANAITTVNVAASTTAQLYPGGSSSVEIKFDNSNDYAVTLDSVTQTVTNPVGPVLAPIVTTDATAACDASTGVTFDGQTGLALVVPAHGVLVHSFPAAAHMSNASDNSCQGKTFSIPVSLHGASS